MRTLGVNTITSVSVQCSPVDAFTKGHKILVAAETRFANPYLRYCNPPPHLYHIYLSHHILLHSRWSHCLDLGTPVDDHQQCLRGSLSRLLAVPNFEPEILNTLAASPHPVMVQYASLTVCLLNVCSFHPRRWHEHLQDKPSNRRI